MSISNIVWISITIYLAIGIVWSYHYIGDIFYPDPEKQNEVPNLIELRNDLKDTINAHGKIKPMILLMLIMGVQWLPINAIALYRQIKRRMEENKQTKNGKFKDLNATTLNKESVTIRVYENDAIQILKDGKDYKGKKSGDRIFKIE